MRLEMLKRDSRIVEAQMEDVEVCGDEDWSSGNSGSSPYDDLEKDYYDGGSGS